MPFIDPGNGGGGGIGQLIPLLQLLQQIQAQQAGQADANLARLPSGGAGMSADQAGLTPKQQKAKYGRVLNPGETVAAKTPDSATKAMMLQQIENMTPEDTDQFVSSLKNQMQGTPGVGTTASRASAGRVATQEGKTAEVQANTKFATSNTVHQTILAGLEEISKAPVGIQAGIGLKAAGLTAPDEEASNTLQTQIKTETQKLALKVLSDPSHPLNKVMQGELGFNAIIAAPGIALGMQNLLDNVGQIAYQRTVGNKALEVAKFQRDADIEKDMAAAESSWAKETANQMGGTVTPRTVLNWKRWREAGGSPTEMPMGVTDKLDAMLSTATQVSQKAFVTQQAEKADPYAKAFLDIAQMASKVSNNNTQQALSKLMGAYYAKTMTAAKYGPRPDNPKDQVKWDAAAKAIQDKMPQLDSKYWFTGGGVDAKVPAGAKAPAAAPVSSPILGPGGKVVTPPPDMSPEDMANIQAIVQAYQAAAGKVPPINLTPPKP